MSTWLDSDHLCVFLVARAVMAAGLYAPHAGSRVGSGMNRCCGRPGKLGGPGKEELER